MIKNKDFNNSSSSNILENPLNSEPTDDNHAANKPYVDSLSENNKNLRDLFTVFNDQDTEFDENNIKKLDSLTFIRNPILDNELSNNKYVDDSLGESTILRFKKSLPNNLKASFRNDVFNLSKFDRIQITNTAFLKHTNQG